MHKYIRHLSEVTGHDVALAGGKGASLGEMTRAGFPVPPGFVILASVYDRYAGEAVMPAGLGKKILSEYKKLNSPLVAVRSSATAEDSLQASWAGMLESYLNTTEDALLVNIKKCWQSLSASRAVAYKNEMEMSSASISIAVIVQKMVDPQISGVTFTVHPVSKDRNQMIVEATRGLGERLVGGEVDPRTYVIDKTSEAIANQSDGKLLDEMQIRKLFTLCCNIEQHFKYPCDIEWAYADGRFHVLQSRPITTL